MQKFKKFVDKFDVIASILVLKRENDQFVFDQGAITNLRNKINQLDKDFESGVFNTKNERLTEIMKKSIMLAYMFVRAIEYYCKYSTATLQSINPFLGELIKLRDFLCRVPNGNQNDKLLVFYNVNEAYQSGESEQSLFLGAEYYWYYAGSNVDFIKYELFNDMDTVNPSYKKSYKRIERPRALNFIIVPLSHRKRDLDNLKVFIKGRLKVGMVDGSAKYRSKKVELHWQDFQQTASASTISLIALQVNLGLNDNK